MFFTLLKIKNILNIRYIIILYKNTGIPYTYYNINLIIQNHEENFYMRYHGDSVKVNFKYMLNNTILLPKN